MPIISAAIARSRQPLTIRNTIDVYRNDRFQNPSRGTCREAIFRSTVPTSPDATLQTITIGERRAFDPAESRREAAKTGEDSTRAAPLNNELDL